MVGRERCDSFFVGDVIALADNYGLVNNSQ